VLPGELGVLESALAGRYRIVGEVGRGGSGIVFEAQDLIQNRVVAIKVLRVELAGARARRRFLQEIEFTKKLNHPNILPLLDSGEVGDITYYVMPFVTGATLLERLGREGQQRIDDILRVARAVLDALDHAHSIGIIHRDIKPSNILLERDRVIVADFGIALALHRTAAEERISSPGVHVGTPAYMSPEQASGATTLDGRTDIYSLGCVLYEMLAGSPPFAGATGMALAARHSLDSVPPLRTVRKSTPVALEEVVYRALEKSPADRFASAAEMLRALEAASSPEALKRTRPRRSLSPRLAMAGLALSTVGFALVFWPRGTIAKFAERDWILVADFEGPPEDPGLATSIRELATAELNQSRFLNTLPRSQLAATMRLAGLPETTRVNSRIARELAYRSSVRAVLEGTVRRVSSNSYAVVLRVTDAEDGTDILTAPGTANESTLIPTVQRLAREVRESLGEHRGTVRATKPLEQVATPSFAAFRKYIDGLALQTRGDGRGSNRLMREALALDTGFATAWFMMAWNYQNERVLDSARWAFGQALARRDRLSELQRYRLEADAAYTLDYDIPTAIRAYDLYLASVPQSWVGHNNRGNYLLAMGRYEDALQSFDSAVASHPFGARQAQIQLMNQAATLVTLERVGDANRVSRDLRPPFSTYVRLMSGVAVGDHGEAVDSIAVAAATAPSSPAWLRLQATAIAAGNRASRGAVLSADSLLAHGSAGTSPDAARWLYRARLLLANAVGRAPPSLPVGLRQDTSVAGVMTRGLSAAALGDRNGANAALARLAAAPPVEQRRLGNGIALIRATMESRAGNWVHVRDLIAGPALRGEHDASILDRPGSLSMRWLAAEAYARLGMLDSAVAVMELALKPVRMPGNEFALRGLIASFAHRRLALWNESRERLPDADRHWRAFLGAITLPDAEVAEWAREAERIVAARKES
jgi:serine/threonine protein kinase/tetratricopeptide (TPR) repeat protein